MANILTYPDALSLASNLKKFVISSVEDIRFKLYCGATLIIDESYSPASDGKITIDVKEVVKNELSFIIPTTDIFLQAGICKEFVAHIDLETKTFLAIRAGAENLAVSATEFLTQNFLTWQPQSKSVGYSQPEWLTYYAPVAGNLKVKFYLTNDTSPVQTLTALAAGSCTSVNMMFSRIMALQAGEKYGYFDVWFENAAAERLTYVQRYIYNEIEAVDEHFLFENSLGGIDTAVFSGESVFAPELTHTEGVYDEESEQLDDTVSRLYQKSTGWKSKAEATWLWDFFRAIRKYKVDSGVIRKITLKESDIKDSTNEDMKSFSFIYRIASDKGLLNIPRSADPLPENLEITTPEGLFFLAPRLSEFPSAEFIDEFLLPVQSPFVQSWMKISLGSIKSSILDSISNIVSPLAHRHSWADLDNIPQSFAPSAHSHAIAGVTGLSEALSGKEASLGNPGTGQDGYLFSSLVNGTRSWVAPYSHPNYAIENGIGGTLGHIKASERTSWTDHASSADKHLTTEERAYFNKLKSYLKFAANDSSMYSTLNFYSESGVSCFGIGEGGSGGSSFNLFDGLTSQVTGMALDSRQGYVLDQKILGKADSNHAHSWAVITNKPASFAPSAHSHSWDSITDKPLSFTPSAHNHAIAGVTGLSEALSGKEASLGNPTVDGQILSSTLGGVRSWVNRYVLPVAAAAVLGGVMVGTGLNANAQGLLSHSDFSVETGIGGTLGHIKSSERSGWNSHVENTSFHLSTDERAYFNKLKTYFLFAADNSSVHTTINFYSESGVSCFGIGAGGGGGAGVNVIDNLISTSTTEALSANMGRYLSNLVSSKSDTGHSHSWDTITSKPVTFTPAAHQHSWSEITSGKPTTLSGYGISSSDTLFDSKYSAVHSHPYLSLAGGTLSTAGSSALFLYTGANTVDNWLTFLNDGQVVRFGIRNPLGTFGLTLVTPTSDYYRIWHEGNFNPSSYSLSTHNHNLTYLGIGANAVSATVAGKLGFFATNETIIGDGFGGGSLWINYRGATGAIINYNMGNGAGSGALAYITCLGFVKSGSSSSYLLLGNGGHKSISDFDAAGAASTVQGNLSAHAILTNNPHAVTAAQVGALSNGGGIVSGLLSTSLGSGGMSLSGNGGPDLGFLGYNYFNINGSESNPQAERTSWRWKFANGGSPGAYLDFRAASAAAGAFTNYFFMSNAGAASFAGSIYSASSIIAETSVKIGNWEFLKNGDSEILLKLSGSLKAKVNSSGDILAYGGVSCFAL